jgi:uncharacterized protein YycO
LWTWSRWSHAELVIGEWCFSSSARDNGVRRKKIDLTSGNWDVVEIAMSEGQYRRARKWILDHEGERYDWANIFRWIFPFVPQRDGQWICFEAVGAMLGLAGSHRLDADDLHAWALANKLEFPVLVDEVSETV